jgi:hypothetical protein
MKRLWIVFALVQAVGLACIASVTLSLSKGEGRTLDVILVAIYIPSCFPGWVAASLLGPFIDSVSPAWQFATVAIVVPLVNAPVWYGAARAWRRIRRRSPGPDGC